MTPETYGARLARVIEHMFHRDYERRKRALYRSEHRSVDRPCFVCGSRITCQHREAELRRSA